MRGNDKDGQSSCMIDHVLARQASPAFARMPTSMRTVRKKASSLVMNVREALKRTLSADAEVQTSTIETKRPVDVRSATDPVYFAATAQRLHDPADFSSTDEESRQLTFSRVQSPPPMADSKSQS